jgi:hypothetical protein
MFCSVWKNQTVRFCLDRTPICLLFPCISGVENKLNYAKLNVLCDAKLPGECFSENLICLEKPEYPVYKTKWSSFGRQSMFSSLSFLLML